MSAALRDRTANEEGEPLRPTREVALRPTREPNAPFVPGPPSPRVAVAPRVVGPRAFPRSTVMQVTPEIAPASPTQQVPSPTPIELDVAIVAALPRARSAQIIAVLRERGMEVTPLRNVPAGPVGLARELGRALTRATIVATILGALGALVGALMVSSEALIPSLGWLPGPAVGAAILAGVLGALGFSLGVLALLFTPARALSPLAEGDRLLVVVRAEGPRAMAAAVIASAGAAVLAAS